VLNCLLILLIHAILDLLSLARLFNPSIFYADQLLNETVIGFSTTERLEILNSNYIPLEVSKPMLVSYLII
jgi:hypothetical protein